MSRGKTIKTLQRAESNIDKALTELKAIGANYTWCDLHKIKMRIENLIKMFESEAEK